jgi:hypothetical protein
VLIVGASFRNTGEILELAGCDYLTISPALLDELQKTEGQVPKKLDANSARDASVKKVSYINNEPEFRYIPPPEPPFSVSKFRRSPILFHVLFSSILSHFLSGITKMSYLSTHPISFPFPFSMLFFF